MGNSILNRRRSLQFGLKSLLLVMTAASLAGAWAAYNLNWIQQRHQAFATHDLQVEPGGSLPWQLSIFGEQGYKKLLIRFDNLDGLRPLTEAEQQERQSLERLFPEATVLGVTASNRFNGIYVPRPALGPTPTPPTILRGSP